MYIYTLFFIILRSNRKLIDRQAHIILFEYQLFNI